MRERLRRHARLIAGALVLLLIAGLGYGLRGAGASHVEPARAAAAAPLATPTAPSPVVAGRAVSAAVPAKPPKQHLAAARSIRAQPPVARRGAAPHGVPSPAPTSRTVGLALRQA